VDKVVNSDTLIEEVNVLVKKIAANGPFAVKACKRAINGGIDLSLVEALELELEEYDKVAHSKDAEEGIAAFLDKRKPSFKGK
jgi:enoyl-CoA hydratase